MNGTQQLHNGEVVTSNKAIAENKSFFYFIDKINTWLVNSLSSVKLTIVLLSLLAVMVLLGAWCPQIPQGGPGKVVEQFGPQTADYLIKMGIADIFHSLAFLLLISFITVNIIFGSFRHVFPKLKLLKSPMPWLRAEQINKMPVHYQFESSLSPADCENNLARTLKRLGYSVCINGSQLTAESGKFGRLAPTVTHIGLLTLLAGVILSSWTGFSGFKGVCPGETLSFLDAEHSQLWLGKLPNWTVRVNETHREDYPSGEAKQWYSNLSVLDRNGKVQKTQTISVNEPLSYNGVDVYQSSWGLKTLKIRFNNDAKQLSLQSMGKLFAAFLPLPQNAVIIFSIRDAQAPLRIFAKREDWSSPKLLSQVPLGGQTDLGGVSLIYEGTVAQTGLQYKCDPGLPIVYLAFIFIIGGISLAAVPHRQVWAQLKESPSGNNNNQLVTIGGTTKKGKISFARQIENIMEKLKND